MQVYLRVPCPSGGIFSSVFQDLQFTIVNIGITENLLKTCFYRKIQNFSSHSPTKAIMGLGTSLVICLIFFSFWFRIGFNFTSCTCKIDYNDFKVSPLKSMAIALYSFYLRVLELTFYVCIESEWIHKVCQRQRAFSFLGADCRNFRKRIQLELRLSLILNILKGYTWNSN